jgi:hypothetical protein
MDKLTPEALKRNQSLLTFYFLYTVLHGALRKWVFSGVSGVNDALFMVQLLLPYIVIGMLVREKTILSCKPLIPYALMLTAMALNPMNLTLFHGIFGFILHFGFWLLMLVYLNEREAFPIENLVRIMLIVCFAETLLTFVQFGLPTSHFLNRYENAGADEVAGFENDGGVRVIGTFSYIAGYGSLLFFMGLFVWALMVQKKQSIPVVLGLASFGLVSAFMNGSRSILLPYVICVVFGFLSYGSFGQKIKSMAVIGGVFILTMVFNVAGKISFVEKAYNSFALRVTSGQKNGEAQSRTVGTFVEVIDFTGKYPLTGIGLGATYQGATNKWGSSQELREYGYCEEEPERIVVEGGFLLLFTRIFLFGLMAVKMRVPLIYSIPVLFYIFFFTLFVFNAYQTALVFLGFALLDKFYYLKETNAT